MKCDHYIKRKGSDVEAERHSVLKNLSDLSVILGGVTTTWAVADVESATSNSLVASAWGAALGFVSLIASAVATAANSVVDSIVSFLLDVGSVIVDGVALFYAASSFPAWVSLGLDIAAGLADAKVLHWLGTW